MYKNLYDSFSHWFNDNRGQVYFYSDTHFNDKDVAGYRGNIPDDEQVKLINNKIGKYDTIVFLGDVGDLEFAKKIRGYKVLIMGNHDSGATNYKRKIITETFDSSETTRYDVYKYATEKYRGFSINIQCDIKKDLTLYTLTVDNHLFDEVYEGALIVSDKIILSHEPIIGLSGMLNIHGHCHSNDYPHDENHMNVCAEHINYVPVQLCSIVKSGRLSNLTTIHRATIDKASRRKNDMLKKGNIIK